MLLESHVAGRWWTPEDQGEALRDAATGEEVARLSTRPVPAREALRHAREVGGPALRTLTFPERAALLKAARHAPDGGQGRVPRRCRTRPARPARTPSSTSTAAPATLLAYASRGRRELPDGTVLVDGPVEQLGRGGTFAGVHVMTPLLGAALQVNAYNFPVWGMLEKLAPALLAGVPSVVKPAPQTAYLTGCGRAQRRRGGAAAGGRAAAARRRRRGAARRARRAGPAQRHRVGGHRPARCGRTRRSPSAGCASPPRRTR